MAELSRGGTALSSIQGHVKEVLELLASRVLGDLPAYRRKKYEQLLTELVSGCSGCGCGWKTSRWRGLRFVEVVVVIWPPVLVSV